MYSPNLGEIASDIRNRGIEVANDLTRLSGVPDVIHAHHHPQTVEALLRFREAPAVFVCHAAVVALEEPFFFPRILRYVAIDDRCRARVAAVSQIPGARIEVILNSVDLERFSPRTQLPPRPRRALVFSNYAHETTQLPAIQEACRQTGLALDVIGLGAETAVKDPESVLPLYDLVFAKARCALEALAVGNAVVLCDSSGVGPMVTCASFDELRRMNFGGGVLTRPLRAAHLIEQIQRYDPADAAEVCRRTRKEAGLVEATQKWIALYRSVILEFHNVQPETGAEDRAMAHYYFRRRAVTVMDWPRKQFRKFGNAPVLGTSISRLTAWVRTVRRRRLLTR